MEISLGRALDLCCVVGVSEGKLGWLMTTTMIAEK